MTPRALAGVDQASSWKSVNKEACRMDKGQPPSPLMETCTMPAFHRLMWRLGKATGPQALLDPELLTQRPLYPLPFHWGFKFPLRPP